MAPQTRAQTKLGQTEPQLSLLLQGSMLAPPSLCVTPRYSDVKTLDLQGLYL